MIADAAERADDERRGPLHGVSVVVTFPISSGSVENLNVSLRQGWTPYLRHARAMVAFPILRCPASSLDDQCVTPYFFGGAVNVAVMIRSSSTCLGRPARIAVDRAHDINSSRSPSHKANAGAGEFAMTNSPKPPTI